MASRRGALILAGLGTATLIAILAGTASSSTSRPAYTDPIEVPGTDVPWDAFDDALCLCYEAQTPTKDLALCVLQRVYPEVPWPSIDADHPTVRTTARVATLRIVKFINRIAAGESPCDVVVVDPPVEPPVEPPEIEDPFPDIAAPGGFATITNGGPIRNPTRLAQYVLGGAAATDARVVRVVRGVASVGFNLYYYSRPRGANDNIWGTATIDGRRYDVGPAWSPWNRSVREHYDAGEKLIRNVSWQGARITAGTYGSPWVPMLNDDGTPVGDGPWDPLRNPSAEVLARLGQDLATMQHVWEQNNG